MQGLFVHLYSLFGAKVRTLLNLGQSVRQVNNEWHAIVSTKANCEQRDMFIGSYGAQNTCVDRPCVCNLQAPGMR